MNNNEIILNIEKELNIKLENAKNGDTKEAYRLGELYFKLNNFLEAFNWFKVAADDGDPVAQYHIGRFLLDGKFFRRDPNLAFQYFKLSADNGYSQAQYQLGSCYHIGIGCEKDDNESFRYNELAANQNHIKAGFYLGLHYHHKHWYTEALQWFMSGAQKGEKESQFFVGLYYEKGNGTVRNINQAINWYQKAANQGEDKAINNLKRINFGKHNNRLYRD